MHTSRIVRINPNSSSDSATNYLSGYITDPKDNYVNVRRGAGTNFAIASRLDVGTFVYYTKTAKNWYKVYDRDYNYLGYVYYDRIKKSR